MVYYSGIPAATDKPSQSQAQFAANFTDLNTVFGIDHVNFTAAINRGEHTKVTYTNVLGADPGLAYPKGSAYTKAVVIGGVNYAELFFETSRSVGANIVRQLTGIVPVVGGAPGPGASIMTPWGIRIACGTFGGSAAGIPNTFAVNFNTILSLVLTTDSNTRYASYTALAVTGFTAWSVGAVTGSYIAIGT